MTKNITITVITVTYNAAATLQRCMDSVSSQIVPEMVRLEHLIVDGQSTDETLSIIQEWESSSSCHFRRYVSEKDNGLYDAMNKGARLAQGQILVFLNADDQFADASSVSRSIAPILSGDSDYVCAPAIVISPRGKYSHVQYPDLSLPYLNHPFNTQTMFVKRADFLRLGGHDLSFKVAGDDEFDCKLIAANLKVVSLAEPTVIAQDGGFGVTHYYAHERARLLQSYQSEILGKCLADRRYAVEYFLSLMRISKVHPSSASSEERQQAGQILQNLHAAGRSHWPWICRVLSRLSEKLILEPIQNHQSVEKLSLRNAVVSICLRVCMILTY